MRQMAEVVFAVPKEHERKIDGILRDNLVSRQSITSRDSKSLGLDTNVKYVYIKGSQDAVDKARDLFKEITSAMPDNEAKGIIEKIEAQDQEAASGMGMIFGD
jgi:hypothetical protein